MHRVLAGAGPAAAPDEPGVFENIDDARVQIAFGAECIGLRIQVDRDAPRVRRQRHIRPLAAKSVTPAVRPDVLCQAGRPDRGEDALKNRDEFPVAVEFRHRLAWVPGERNRKRQAGKAELVGLPFDGRSAIGAQIVVNIAEGLEYRVESSGRRKSRRDGRRRQRQFAARR